jgi:Flp pilus assembly protein TadD
LQDGHPETSLALVGRAISADAHEPRYRFVLGQTHQALRHWGEAADAYELALNLQPDFLDAWNNLGICRQRRGQFTRAVAAYRQALALDLKNAGVMANLGTVLREIGELSEAVELLRSAVTLEPVVALNNVACLMRMLGRIDDAETALDRALQREPRNASLHDTLGNVHKDGGELDAAIASFRKSLELEPGSAATHSNLAYTLSFQASGRAGHHPGRSHRRGPGRLESVISTGFALPRRRVR